MSMPREYAELQRMRWLRALEEIAREMGQGTREYRLFGALAWGRFEGESRPDERKEDVFFGLGFLQGFRDAALLAACEFKLKSEEPLRLIYKRMEPK